MRLSPIDALPPLCIALLVAGCGGGAEVQATRDDGSARSERRAAAVDSPGIDASQLMNWAEVAYPQYFKPAGQPNQTSAPYIYRFYPDTGNYLGVAGDKVAVLGPVSGGAILEVGTLADFECEVLLAQCVAPAVTSQPVSRTVVAGGSGVFDVSVSGGPSLKYQWRRNDLPIAGASGAILQLPGIGTADNGARFSVQVSNAKGTVLSATATLFVEPAVDAAQAQSLASGRGCLGCHGIDFPGNGPAWRDVAARYAVVPSPISGLVTSIRFGSRGQWGGSMSGQNVSPAEATLLARYILSLNN